jgi:hypothetical protein
MSNSIIEAHDEYFEHRVILRTLAPGLRVTRFGSVFDPPQLQESHRKNEKKHDEAWERQNTLLVRESITRHLDDKLQSESFLPKPKVSVPGLDLESFDLGNGFTAHSPRGLVFPKLPRPRIRVGFFVIDGFQFHTINAPAMANNMAILGYPNFLDRFTISEDLHDKHSNFVARERNDFYNEAMRMLVDASPFHSTSGLAFRKIPVMDYPRFQPPTSGTSQEAPKGGGGQVEAKPPYCDECQFKDPTVSRIVFRCKNITDPGRCPHHKAKEPDHP